MHKNTNKNKETIHGQLLNVFFFAKSRLHLDICTYGTAQRCHTRLQLDKCIRVNLTSLDLLAYRSKYRGHHRKLYNWMQQQ